jgi:hypothetical protein
MKRIVRFTTQPYNESYTVEYGSGSKDSIPTLKLNFINFEALLFTPNFENNKSSPEKALGLWIWTPSGFSSSCHETEGHSSFKLNP